jgi:hypothetical protein
MAERLDFEELPTEDELDAVLADLKQRGCDCAVWVSDFHDEGLWFTIDTIHDDGCRLVRNGEAEGPAQTMP